MEEELIEILNKTHTNYIPNVLNNNQIEKIYQLFKNNVEFEPIDDYEHLYIGLYYKIIKNDNYGSKKYFFAAAEKGNDIAMLNVALNRAFDLSIVRYGYIPIQSDAERRKEYYLMSIEKGNIDAIFYLGRFCDGRGDDKEAVKYYLMAVEKGDGRPLKELVRENLFEYINDRYIFFKLCVQYQNYLKAEDIYKIIIKINTNKLSEQQKHEFIKLITEIKQETDDIPFIIKSYINLIKYNLDIMKLHFDYSLNGLGYEDAKKDFISEISL